MKIAICDDEIICIDRLRQLLQPYMEKESLEIDSFLSGEEFLYNSYGIEQYDIIFLDIEMFDVSGLDVAERLRSKGSNAIIIFITSYINYVSDTFRLGAFQFLVKPIEEKIFKYDFERALRSYKSTHSIYKIRWKESSYVVENGDIYYIEGYNRHLYVYTFDKGYECIGKLPEEEKKLKPYNFVRCHQGYIVNMCKIKEINKTSIILNNDVVIPIGRKYREELLETFNLYLVGRTV